MLNRFFRLAVCRHPRVEGRKRVVSYRLYHIAVASLLAGLIGCASIQPPPGGPEDKTGPVLVGASPADRSLNVPLDTRLRFEFEDPVNRGSFQSAFTITPYVNGTVKYNWPGYDAVEVILPETLRPNTTYSVSLGRDLKSYRGNPLEQPTQITFSTGPYIDTAILSGFVVPPLVSTEQQKFTDLFVFAYELNEHRPDTLDLRHTRPDLISQPDDKGRFQFFAMKQHHTYRVVAVRDVYRNHLYDPEVDQFGLPTTDVTLDSIITKDFRIRLAAVLDTLHPLVEDVAVRDSLHVQVHFSEALDTASVSAQNFRLTSTSGASIGIVGAFIENTSRPNFITLLLASVLQPQMEYTLGLNSAPIHDRAGNTLNDSAGAPRFTTGQSMPEVTPLAFSRFSIPDSLRDVSLTLRPEISFTDAVNRQLVEQSITLTDSLGHALPVQFNWSDDSRLTVSTKQGDTLTAGAFYTLTLNTTGVRSPSPLMLHMTPDTIRRIRFQTVSLRDFGRVAGTIRVADSLMKPGDIIVVELIGTNNSERMQTRLAEGVRRYSFERVLKGRYRARAYVLRGTPPQYDPGALQPFRFAAPSGDFPQEVDVRARWEIDKLDFDMK